MDIIKQVEHNIDMICDGLKNDSYKKVREGFVNLCTLITDNKVIIELITPNTSQTYTITKSRFEGLYTFESDTMCRTQSPESFARWLYWHTSTRKIILDYAKGNLK